MTAARNPICIARKELASVTAALALSLLTASADSVVTFVTKPDATQTNAFFHGHNHHAEHYRWPDPKRHAADLDFFFDGQPPANARQYDVVSCGNVCWVIRVRGDQLIGANFKGPDWNADPAAVFVKSLKP